MFSLLLIIIYIAFISLGLPDSLLGSAWPVMHMELDVPLSFAGIISMIISAGTIVSSLLSDRLTRRLGVGLLTTMSVAMTAIALFGFSQSSHFIFICLWAIPYGLGAGAVDAALNNYVALHYAGRHMNWLHCFWGVGASISPFLMAYALTNQLGWSSGYRFIGIIQILLTAGLIFSLPLWKIERSLQEQEAAAARSLTLKQAIKIPAVKSVLLTFFSYCSLEVTAGLWASTYLVSQRGIHEETAARFASLFYLGITAGRFLCGFIAEKLGDQRMIRSGLLVILMGISLILLPISGDRFVLSGLILIGVGCAPIYPAIIHSTPHNFGSENSQAIIGIQMASAYVGSTAMPPFFGWISQYLSLQAFPYYLLFFALLMLCSSEYLNRMIPDASRMQR